MEEIRGTLGGRPSVIDSRSKGATGENGKAEYSTPFAGRPFQTRSAHFFVDYLDAQLEIVEKSHHEWRSLPTSFKVPEVEGNSDQKQLQSKASCRRGN